MKYERVTRVRPQKAEAQAGKGIVAEETDADLLNDIDELLDEIDAVLEDQAVLVSYRQRSGE